MKYHNLELKTKTEGGVFDIKYHDSISFHRNSGAWLNLDLTKELIEEWFATGNGDLLDDYCEEINTHEFWNEWDAPDVQPISWENERQY